MVGCDREEAQWCEFVDGETLYRCPRPACLVVRFVYPLISPVCYQEFGSVFFFPLKIFHTHELMT